MPFHDCRWSKADTFGMVSMRLINIKALLEREQLMSTGRQVDRRTEVVEFRDDEATEYVTLSHRWVNPTEVDYEEMVNLAKMDTQERDEIRGRLGYKKILETCHQANKDGYEWVWIDTCCIDKRSSAELSEAVNSMYRWYANSRVCYAYFHDVPGSFPLWQDAKKYPKSNGWPEWFSRGWTLQEMIAPSNVQFFNEHWQAIGNKKMRASTLARITGVPEHILMQGLFENRPCVAQIISWAAKRTTTRVEDRAYSLMGLLDVNMPMLYGEGKKAFHRLQLEIIRSSNDQSIFAWGHSSPDVRTGSTLADDPNFFCDCSDMELMDYDEFILSLKRVDPEVKLPSIGQDCFGVFPITNRGIHIWMPLCHHRASKSVFEAYLPCRKGSFVVKINLVLWNSNYYRYSGACPSGEGSLLFRQVYVRYEDMSSCNVTFEIDDSAIAEKFSYYHAHASELEENIVTLTNANSFCIKTYCERQEDGCFAVVFGQCFGLDWVDLINYIPSEFDCLDAPQLLVKAPDCARSMADIPPQNNCRRHLWVQHFRVSTWIVRISRVIWERSMIGVRMEVLRDSCVHYGLEWKTYDIDVSDFLSCTWIITMIVCRGATSVGT